ncbi:MAG: MBL fold metallo-hydrolase [Pyrinomonadaceae bacterium]
MKIQLLPSTVSGNGRPALEQRLTCFLVDDCVAIDAGSLALSLDDAQRSAVRDIIITHPHLDHTATLPIFLDELFATLDEPVRVYAAPEVIEILERDVFNWRVFPRFSELRNEWGPVIQYVPVNPCEEFTVRHLRVTAVPVNHSVPTVGLILTDGERTIGVGSDTGETEEFWRRVNLQSRLDALLIEASFPESMAQLAALSGHLTPATLRTELAKLKHRDVEVLAMHLKPAYREILTGELESLNIDGLRVMLPGVEYCW